MARGYRTTARGEYFSFDVDWSEIDRALKDLPKTYAKTALQNTLKIAGKPIKEEGRKNAPIGPTGNLAKSIEISTKLKGRRLKTRESVIVFVGSTAPHAHLVEFGTVERFAYSKPKKRWNKTEGDHAPKSVGVMPSNSFFTHTWDKTKFKAYRIIQKEMWNQLVKRSKTLATKAAKGTLSKSAIRVLGG